MTTPGQPIWKSLPGPEDITRSVLPNGITVLTRTNDSSPSVVISGYMLSGSQFDPAERLGLAHFTAACLMRGVEGLNFQQIFNELESVGASLGFGASVHTTSFSGRALAEDLPLLFSIVSRCLRQPTFPPDQVERLRANFMTGFAIRAQDTSEMCSLTFDQLLFPEHPYGRPEDGFPETVKPITREELIAFHRKHYGPRGMVIVVVGAVSAAKALEEVQKALGDWINPEQPEPPAIPPVTAPVGVRRHIALPGKMQTDLVMGTIGPVRKSPDFLAASLGNNILGQFGMMGRIGDVVREQAGLAYYASTSLNGWLSAGSWEVSAGVNPVNLQKAIDLIQLELRKFVSEPVSVQELTDSQANFIGRLPLSMESNGGVAAALMNLERFQLGLDYYQRYADLVRAVTPELVLEVARRYLNPDQLVVVSSGPDLAE